MAFEDINFPVYRKYKNGKHFFKIMSRTAFEEIQLIGGKKVIHTIAATQLPEFNHIYDLVYNFEEFGSEIDSEEYELVRNS